MLDLPTAQRATSSVTLKAPSTRSALNFTRSPGLKFDTSAASTPNTMLMPGMPQLSIGPRYSVIFACSMSIFSTSPTV